MADNFLNDPHGWNVSAGGQFGWHPSGISVPSGNIDSTTILDVHGFDGSGPWYILQQSLEVEYRRVPVQSSPGSFDFDEFTDMTLSSWTSQFMDNKVRSGSGDIGGTALVCHIKASVNIRKSTDIYDSSSYQQPQKFQFYSTSADKRGLNTGLIKDGCLGPAGMIKSSQPYYLRRPWNGDYDKRWRKTLEGWNFQSIWYLGGREPEQFLSDKLWNPEWKRELRSCRGVGTQNLYLFRPGAYCSYDDDPDEVRQLLDQIGEDISNWGAARIFNSRSGRPYARNTAIGAQFWYTGSWRNKRRQRDSARSRIRISRRYQKNGQVALSRYSLNRHSYGDPEHTS